jgi:hypothetical protein
LALTLCSTFIASPLQADACLAGDRLWAINGHEFFLKRTAGKIGVNDVTIGGKKLTPQDAADLSQPVTIESRGGKIANSHDGLTFFYTTLPSGKFCLAGHRDGGSVWPGKWRKPAAQEGAGLLVRDIIGVPRQQPLKAGYEEFPAASNMVMNAIMTQDKKDHHRIKLQAITREGISHPWGNAGAEIKRRVIKRKWITANAGIPPQA